MPHIPCLQVLVGIYFFVGVMGCLLGVKRFEYALLLLPLGLGVLVFHVLVSCCCHSASLLTSHCFLHCTALHVSGLPS
jgi:hypothetical protein